ncbi:Gramicidin S synthase 1 [Streptococcus infantarius subsp. infantarius]|nr:Gramicidin S synthase 1 [Streptococcus infantarius subsp. infantarius]
MEHKSNNFENYEFSQEIQKNYLKLEFSQDNLKVIQGSFKIEHFLLSLIVRCYAMISQKNNIQVMLEGHGRMFKDYLESVIDVVGWFTSEYPVNFDVKRDFVAQCDEIERRMSAVPNNGVMYSKVKKSLSRVACPDILFNYLGNSITDTSWKVLKRADYSINNMISDKNYQKSIFMVLLEKKGNTFEISITSDSQHYSLECMEEFCKLVKQEFENFLS